MLAEDWRLGASYVDGWVESQDTRMDGYGWDALRVSRLSFLVWRRHNPVIRRGRWLGIRRLGRVYGCPALARRRCCVHRRLVYRRLVASCRGASGVVWRVTSQAMRLSHSMRCSVRLHPSRLHLHLHLHLLRFVGVFHISGPAPISSVVAGRMTQSQRLVGRTQKCGPLYYSPVTSRHHGISVDEFAGPRCTGR